MTKTATAFKYIFYSIFSYRLEDELAGIMYIFEIKYIISVFKYKFGVNNLSFERYLFLIYVINVNNIY